MRTKRVLQLTLLALLMFVFFSELSARLDPNVNMDLASYGSMSQVPFIVNIYSALSIVFMLASVEGLLKLRSIALKKLGELRNDN